jgi:hypothetical protein
LCCGQLDPSFSCAFNRGFIFAESGDHEAAVLGNVGGIICWIGVFLNLYSDIYFGFHACVYQILTKLLMAKMMANFGTELFIIVPFLL